MKNPDSFTVRVFYLHFATYSPKKRILRRKDCFLLRGIFLPVKGRVTVTRQVFWRGERHEGKPSGFPMGSERQIMQIAP